MNLQKLRSKDPSVVEDYVTRKFKRFNRFTYTKKTRISKCIQYWIAADGSMHGQAVIERVYQQIFRQLFPEEEAEIIKKKASSGPSKIESSEALDRMETRRDALAKTLITLERWKLTQAYQEGERFMSSLQSEVAEFDESVLNPTEFSTEFSQACKAQITSSVELTPEEVSARFDLLVGFQQSAALRFEAASVDWGVVSGKLEEAFKAGIWANGSAKASMSKLGFSAELQAAIAMGAQLNVEGELAWSKGKGKLSLGGKGEVFVGGRASGEAKLSLHARKGLEASIKAGAFAGFSAEVTGSCEFTYDGKSLAKVAATAGVTFGAGAEFAASIKAPIFGPTRIEFDANLTVGLGVAAKAEVEINFSETALAASQQFRTVVYWRTLARGYEMTLMNSDARNLYYLNKAIRYVKNELNSADEAVTSFNKVPMDKRPLLVFG
jgi:hypothetical protein